MCPTITELNRHIQEVRFKRHMQRLKRRLAHLRRDRTFYADLIRQVEHELATLNVSASPRKRYPLDLYQAVFQLAIRHH